jgi:hypothetical protein
VWALGTDSAGTEHILHFDGVSLQETPFPGQGTPGTITKIAAAPGGYPWAIGPATILRWDGAAWRSVALPHTDKLTAIQVVGPNDVWAAGQGTAFRGTGQAQASFVYHWDGASWTTLPYTEIFSIINDIHVVSATDVWAVGQFHLSHPPFQVGLRAHWDGTRWIATTTSDDPYQEIVGPPDGSSLTVTTGRGVLYFDGTTWTSAVLPQPPPGTAVDAIHLAYLPDTGVTLAVGRGTVNTTPPTFGPLFYRTSG